MPCDLSDHCHWHTTNRFRYLYPEPVSRVQTCLRLLPRVRHGAQHVVRTHLFIDPPPRAARSWTDDFGNTVLEVEHPRLPTHLDVTADCCFNVTTDGPPEPRSLESPADPGEVRRLFLSPTRLVDRTREFELLAMELRRSCDTDEALAWETMRQVYQEMRYLPGSTTVATAASDAFAQRTGVCQDFAHVMLALCRAAGLPARYVSGHMQGEGQMHAWVEAFYAPTAGGSPIWHALDPTHDRAPAGGYVTIAVGRDFADVSPISGRCYGPAPGHLSSHQETRCFLREILSPCE
jgi:transglutaminase-like putative cysteine protease